MNPLTLKEAAQFLRMSRSSLYQRKDIPRYRRPGSRVIIFDQDELEMWLRKGRMGGEIESLKPETILSEPVTIAAEEVVEISAKRVYHRNPRYR
jgi:predicted DNA-binding transcriptional regulator AlpA